MKYRNFLSAGSIKRLVILCSFIAVRAAAQDTLSLQGAINVALQNSLNIRISKSYVDIAATYNSYGIAGGLPSINIAGSDVQQSTSVNQKLNSGVHINGNGAPSNSLAVGVTASVPVYNGGRIVTAKKRLQEIYAQSNQQLKSRIQIVVANVMLKYYDIIRQQNYAGTLQKSIDVYKKRLEIVKTQQAVGLANNADLFQSQVDLNLQVQALQSQQLIIDQDKTDLLTLLTLKPDSSVVIRDSIIIDKNITLDSIIGHLNTNPDVVAAGQQISINRFIERETAAQRYPSLSLNTGYNVSSNQSNLGNFLLNQSYGPFVGVTLGVPIFNGNIYKKQQQVAGINVKIAALQKDTLVNNYTSNIVKNWQAYNSNIQQLETAHQTYLLSQKLLDLVLLRFQLKQATIIDVTQAQISFENAGYLLVNLSYSAKAAEIQLKRLGNRLPY